MHLVILGDGPLGHAVAASATSRGDSVAIRGRPVGHRHPPSVLADADVVVEASRGNAVASNLRDVLDAGPRRLVVATTGWDAADDIAHELRGAGAAAVTAPNFSLGAALFGRLVEVATELFGTVVAFEPYLVEWHRRNKADRPSGTAIDLARRLVERHPGLDGPDALETVSIRAGSSPGMHLVGFDAPGETVELRLTARDRSAYAAGILASADWLVGAPRAPGAHPFTTVIDDLLARPASAA